MTTLQKGFTLTEISIVTTIVVVLGIGILIALNPITQIFKGYDAVRKADLAKLRAAFEAYYEDHLCYPPSSILDNCGGDQLKPYIDSIPCDPNTNKPYVLYIDKNEIACPQNFAIYTTLSNIFDPQGNAIPECEKTYAVYNSSARNSFLISGCTGRRICSKYYGCRAGVCIQVAEDTLPSCSPNYCVANCYNNCQAYPDEMCQ